MKTKNAEKGGAYMEKKILVTAAEIAEELGVSRAFAYGLIKKLNRELEEKGYITIAGKVSRQYYQEKLYGAQPNTAKGA